MKESSKWSEFKANLLEFDNIIEYNNQIEKFVLESLKLIFPSAKITEEKRQFTKYFYDYLVEFTDFKLFSEIKFDKITLQRYWENQIALISKEIAKLNSRRRKKIKYLLILIESKDSIAKLKLEPIYTNILVMNLKMLFKIRNYIVHKHVDSFHLFQKIIKESSGILYDDFIINLLNILKDFNLLNFEGKLGNLYINDSILHLNRGNIINFYERQKSKDISEQKQILERILRFEYENQREATRTDLIQILNLKSDESYYYLNQLSSKVDYSTSEIPSLKSEVDSILNKLKNPTLYDLMVRLDYNFNDAKKIGKFLREEKIIKQFPRFPKKKSPPLQFLFLLPQDNEIIKDYENLIQRPLIKRDYKVEKITTYVDLTKLMYQIKKATLIIADLTTSDPNLFYILGRAHQMGKQIIHIIPSSQKLPSIVKTDEVIYYKKPLDIFSKLKEEILAKLSEIGYR